MCGPAGDVERSSIVAAPRADVRKGQSGDGSAPRPGSSPWRMGLSRSSGQVSAFSGRPSWTTTDSQDLPIVARQGVVGGLFRTAGPVEVFAGLKHL